MIVGLAALLVCQLAGEALAHGLSLPAPGPVVGMALMLGLLVIRASLRQRFGGALPAELADDGIERASYGVLAHLSLLFVPAGVGVVQNLDVFARHGVALAAAVAGSTILALAATAVVFRIVAKAMGADGGESEEAS